MSAFREFSNALRDLHKAEAAREAAMSEVQYDRGYFCYRESEEVDRCAEIAEQVFLRAVAEASLAKSAGPFPRAPWLAE